MDRGRGERGESGGVTGRRELGLRDLDEKRVSKTLDGGCFLCFPARTLHLGAARVIAGDC
jgi:hypothetical protein